MRIKKPCAQPVTYIQDDMAIHDFDRVMANFSIGLAQYLMVDRLIGNIRGSMIKKVYAINTNEIHHSVTLELLKRNWGIGLEEAKYTLKATTQDCIRSALIPLKSKYHTYLILQRLRRLSCKFYTDTLFSKQKYIIGRKCA